MERLYISDDVMTDSPLISFWIVPPDKHGPLGFGVTAFSLNDAFQIIQDAGFRLPEDRNTLQIKEGIKVSDLDHRHVVMNMGPIVVRGMWYPFLKVGV
jgi:hypothetical protein